MRVVALRLAAWLCCLVAAGGALGQERVPGVPQPDHSVRDREFGVTARHYGLERRVEMLQWQRAPGGYAAVWSELPIDSSGFDAVHRNPPAFPLQSRRWIATKITIDDAPLDPAVVAQLGQWRLLRPSFSALPANLSATFQPEGDGLGSADNPLDPHVGDLRIHWRELVLPPLDDQIALHEGRWQLVPAAATVAAPAGASPADQQPSTPASAAHRPWWAGGVALVLIAALAARRRNRSRNR